MKFKIGDKVRVRKDLIMGEQYGVLPFVGMMNKQMGEFVTIRGMHPDMPVYEIVEDGGNAYWTEEMFEPIHKTDAEIMTELIEGRNKKPVKTISDENLLNDPIEPRHYRDEDGKDLFDELYERFYHSKKMFTGREVVIIVMKFVAERYIRRYPNKNPEDLSKGIYTLERLKQYEENTHEK